MEEIVIEASEQCERITIPEIKPIQKLDDIIDEWNQSRKIFYGDETVRNQKKKEVQISALIGELKPLINDIGDATLVVPLIKEYMELGIKNDEQLIKMSTIIQRALSSNKSEEEGFGMTEDEKKQLLTEIEKFKPKK